jgi:hypothetical protein
MQSKPTWFNAFEVFDHVGFFWCPLIPLTRILMSLGNMHGPATDESIVRVSWVEDSWQQGDPMFDAIDELLQIQVDRNLLPRDPILSNPEGYARRWQDLPANLPPLTMPGGTNAQK